MKVRLELEGSHGGSLSGEGDPRRDGSGRSSPACPVVPRPVSRLSRSSLPGGIQSTQDFYRSRCGEKHRSVTGRPGVQMSTPLSPSSSRSGDGFPCVGSHPSYLGPVGPDQLFQKSPNTFRGMDGDWLNGVTFHTRTE